VRRPVCQLMEGDIVELVRAFEPLECRHGDEVAARHIESFAMSFACVRSRRAQELVGQVVACIWIANARRLTCGDAFGQAFALVDVEHGVLPRSFSRAFARSSATPTLCWT